MLKRLLVLNTYYIDIESLKYSFSKQEKYFFLWNLTVFEIATNLKNAERCSYLQIGFWAV